MILPKPLPEPPSAPLPLFRPEAIEARQQKFYGEILLIRPFSLTLLIALGIGISAAVLAYLLFGTYTEKTRVSGILLAGGGPRQMADFYVPAQAMKSVQPGELVQIHCQSCPQSISARVSEISQSVVGREEVALRSSIPVRAPMYRVTMTLSPAEGVPVTEGTRMEADLPLGRRPLLQWLFERGDSSGAGK
jgi:hypothetical protein